MSIKNKSVFEILIALIFFFCFFEDFAIYNFRGTWGFGLQTSWFLCIVFSILYLIWAISSNKAHIDMKIPTIFLFTSLMMITVLDWCIMCLLHSRFSVIVNGDRSDIDYMNEMLLRSFFHTTYIIFLFIVSIILYSFWGNSTFNISKFVKKYLFTYAFIFIGIWGIYQWITTFDFLKYNDVFNNNISYGFTYLRFKGAHRTSSVFSEPSSYGFYLGFLFPAVFSYLAGSTNLFIFKQNTITKVFVLALYLAQVLMAQTYSLIVMLPIILIISINKTNISKRKKTLIDVIAVLFGILLVIVLPIIVSGRMRDILNGNDLSTIVRFNALLYGFKLMIVNPMFGTGYGTYRAMDMISGTVAYFGICGIVCLAIFLYNLFKISKRSPTANLIFWCNVCFIFVGCSGNSLFELLPFWIIPNIIIGLSCKNQV